MDSSDNACGPWGHKELDMTGQLGTHTHAGASFSRALKVKEAHGVAGQAGM